MGSWADDVEQEEQNNKVSQLSHWQTILQLSKNRDTDNYNDRGINVSAQHRRQIIVPWVLVDYTAKQRPEDETDSIYATDSDLTEY